METTTSINDLPSDPSVGTSNNVVLQTTENKQVSFHEQNTYEINETTNNMNSISNQKIMNEVVTGIQQASMSGSTGLPSRDISMYT